MKANQFVLDSSFLSNRISSFFISECNTPIMKYEAPKSRSTKTTRDAFLRDARGGADTDADDDATTKALH